MHREKVKLIVLLIVFLALVIIPFGSEVWQQSLINGLLTLQDYAQHHTLFCLVPAFFIAGAIAVFIRKDTVIRFLGAKAKKYVSYSIASVAGGILAVCSCTILPLFAGIYKRGSGLGPAITFLYAGPAINMAAIFLTGTVLGWELSIIRLIFSIIIAIIVGMIMGRIYQEKTEKDATDLIVEEEFSVSKLSLAGLFLPLLVILVLGGAKISAGYKYSLIGLAVLLLLAVVKKGFDSELNSNWLWRTWYFTKRIIPYLFIGIFAAGILGVALPQEVVQQWLGGNRFQSSLMASVLGATMYFATLTEVPIIEQLMKLGMGKGPALSLFLAGYSLSLPNILVLLSLLGKKKVLVYYSLVVGFSALAGFIYGNYIHLF